MRSIRIFVIILMIVSSLKIANAPANTRDINRTRELRNGFVYLDQVAPSIRVNIKYATKDNFLEMPLADINHNSAILTKEAAIALAKAQEELMLRGYSLVVYNAYIPQQAVKQMEQSIASGIANDITQLYFPYLTAEQVQKYISDKRDNIRGSTVDVSIISATKHIKNKYFVRKRAYLHKHLQYLDDGTKDMGTSYDTFDSFSCHDCQEVTPEAQNNRKLLKAIMQNHGFRASKLVWWKYTYVREPFPDSTFDFSV